MTRPNISEEIEKLIDASSLLDVLTAIECVCSEKAAIDRAASGNTVRSRDWDAAALAVGACLRRNSVSRVS